MKVLITGGCGFIGTNFIRYFYNKHRSYSIINVDKLTYAGNLENLIGFEKKKNYRFAKADISNAAQMNRLFRHSRPDAVINFAAESHVDRSISEPATFIKTNVEGVGVLLNCAIEYDVKKFLQISTDEVYGSILHGKFRETSILNPSSPYSASKSAADCLVIAYHRTFNLPVLITRSSNNYGPYQFPEKFIPLVIFNALQNKKIPLYGDGLHIRDWIYVEDNCKAIDMVFHKGRVGEIYNIGGGYERTNAYVVDRILHAVKKPSHLISHIKDRPGHDRRYALSISKIKKDLGWQPETSFEDGLTKTIDWYQNHETWLRHTQSGEYRRFYRKYYSKLGLKDT